MSKEPKFEALLDSFGVTWEYMPSIAVGNIDRNASHGFQVRIGKVILPEVVEDYVTKLRNGVEFPALIGFDGGNGLFTLLDGNQRTDAYIKVKRQKTDMYNVITDDSGLRHLIAYACNTLNGAPATTEDKLAHANFLVGLGNPIEDVAKMFHLSPSRVRDAIYEFEGQARAKRLGVEGPWLKVEVKRTKIRLHKGLSLDSVFALAIKFVSKYPRSNAAEVSNLISRVTGYSSEEDQLKCVRGMILAAEKAEKDAATKGRGSFLVNNPAGVLSTKTGYFTKPGNTEMLLTVIRGMTQTERSEARDQLTGASHTIQKLLAELG